MDIDKIIKEISEEMFPYLEVGARDYGKEYRDKLVNILNSKLKFIFGRGFR